jgi:hypothetical protein
MYGISDDNIRSCGYCIGDPDMAGPCRICGGPYYITDRSELPLRDYLKKSNNQIL